MRIIIVFCLLGWLSFPTIVQANTFDLKDDESQTSELQDQLNLEDIQGHWDLLMTDYHGYLPELEKKSLTEFIKNEGKFSFQHLLLGLLKYLFHELLINSKLLGVLLLLTIFSVVLQTMHDAFENSSISRIAYFVVYIVLIYIAMNSFATAFSYTKETIDTLTSFMIALVPLVLSLMATIGSFSAVTFFHPLAIFLIHISGILISKVILPLLFLGAILKITSSLSDRYQVTHLAQLFRTVSLGILGAFLTVFIGVMSVQGSISAVQDGLVLRAAKFVTGNLIPVVGRTFTDATDTVLGASLLLKNAVGLVGLIIIVLLVIFPAIKLLVIALIYKVAAAILQPIGDGPVIASLHTISKYMFYILACLLTVSLMFFLSIIIFIISGNIVLLFR